MKSFILSFFITAIICALFMRLFENKANTFPNNLSIGVFIVLAVLFFAGYLLALYWGATGFFKEQCVFNFLGICFSLFGLGIYGAGYAINAGSGKETPGQFDHNISKIEINQQAALNELLQQTNTNAADVKFIAYWGMNKNPDSFAICVQKGNIIALQIKDKTVTDVKAVSKLVHLNWLVLENCNLKSIAGLSLPYLERLAVNHNQLTSLTGFENEPKVSWLNFQDNPITDSSALKNHPNKELYIIN